MNDRDIILIIENWINEQKKSILLLTLRSLTQNYLCQMDRRKEI